MGCEVGYRCIGSQSAFQLNLATGATIGSGVSFTANAGSNDIAFDPNISKFVIGNGSTAQSFLPPSTLAALPLGTFSPAIDDMSSLTHARNSNEVLPSQDVLFVADATGTNRLYRLDFVGAPTNQYVPTTIGTLSHKSGGLAFINSFAKLAINDNDFAYVKVKATDDIARNLRREVTLVRSSLH